MKKIPFLLILMALAVGLSGCMGRWKKETKKSTNKKVAHNVGSGVPLARYKEGDKRFWDDDVEAFVLEEDDRDHRYSTSEPHISDHFNDDIRAAELAWSEETKGKNAFEPVYFSFDDYSIRKDQEAVVEYDTQQAKEAVSHGKMVKVEGHSDRQCISQTYNMAVSQKRAHTVANKLADSGVDRDAIKAVGYGDSKVAVDVPGREQRNRRVEFVALVS